MGRRGEKFFFFFFVKGIYVRSNIDDGPTLTFDLFLYLHPPCYFPLLHPSSFFSRQSSSRTTFTGSGERSEKLFSFL